MATPEAICPACGAINQLRAQTCWRCLGALDAQAAEPEADVLHPGDTPPHAEPQTTY